MRESDCWWDVTSTATDDQSPMGEFTFVFNIINVKFVDTGKIPVYYGTGTG
jgi:hypothetical protein